MVEEKHRTGEKLDLSCHFRRIVTDTDDSVKSLIAIIRASLSYIAPIERSGQTMFLISAGLFVEKDAEDVLP